MIHNSATVVGANEIPEFAINVPIVTQPLLGDMRGATVRPIELNHPASYYTRAWWLACGANAVFTATSVGVTGLAPMLTICGVHSSGIASGVALGGVLCTIPTFISAMVAGTVAKYVDLAKEREAQE